MDRYDLFVFSARIIISDRVYIFQQTPGDQYRHDPFAIQVGTILGMRPGDTSRHESSPGYGDARFGGVGFNANGTCVKDGARFIATNRHYRRQNYSEWRCWCFFDLNF